MRGEIGPKTLSSSSSIVKVFHFKNVGPFFFKKKYIFYSYSSHTRVEGETVTQFFPSSAAAGCNKVCVRDVRLPVLVLLLAAATREWIEAERESRKIA